MSKTRFSSTDVKAAVRDLRNKVLGLRLANIYDMDDNKTYILKFSSSGSGPSNENKKLFLLLESGVRFHTTKFSRDKNELPAPFTMKLRRFIRLKRLEDIRQIGFDRVVDLKFGSGEGAYHLILELYAQGNIILTDCNYEIISLLRSHQFEGDVSVKVNEIYPLSYTTSMTTLAENRKLDEGTGQVISDTDVNAFLALCQRIESENLLDESASSKKKTTTIKQALLSKSSVYASFGPEIIDHCLSKTGIPSSTKLAKVLILSRDVVHGLLLELSSAETILASVDKVQEGYILYKESEPQSSSSESTTMREYVEFVPYLFDQHLSKPHETYVDFDEAVDNYFLKIEEQKLKKHAVAAEENAKKKVLKVTSEQQQLIEGLSKAQTDLEEQASLVEMYAEDVDKVCLVLNSAMASGMSWDDIAEMVEQETKKGNPIASLVAELRLDQNTVVVRLEDPYDDDDHDSRMGSSRVKCVAIDLSLTAYANARTIYASRKHAKVKEQKTIEVSTRVIQNVEATVLRALETQKLKRSLNAIRTTHWFEKFNWFLTSEGYLCLSGRDAQQNELLVKRYLRPMDAYVHADVSGAASCIVRSKSGGAISPFALQEAGCMTVCRSGAWTAKAMIGSYWVHANQVSKSAPSGEFLTTGSFMIYGKKNYLPPRPLEMGFGILFRLDDGSVFRHLGERKDKDLMSIEESESVWSSRANSTAFGDETDEAVDADAVEENEIEIEEKEEMMLPVIPEESYAALVVEDADDVDSEEVEEEAQPSRGKKDEKLDSAVESHPVQVKGSSNTKAKGGKSEPFPKKKALSQKKARRYAEQDDEDKELALLALGHIKLDTKQIQRTKAVELKSKAELERRQAKVGIKNAKASWSALLDETGEMTKSAISDLMLCGKLFEGDFDESEMRALAEMPDAEAVEVLALFGESDFDVKVGNKSGFLAGIIRRCQKDKALPKKTKAAVVKEPVVLGSLEDEVAEMQVIAEDEGLEDEEAGALADDLEKLTGVPKPEDTLLYAIPMCGPYSVFGNWKYKMKLTPGTQKKGKAVKQAIEVFMRNKDLQAAEKSLMKALTDPEMVAIMIGDVKLSTPGLQQIKTAQRGQKKAKAKGKGEV